MTALADKIHRIVYFTSLTKIDCNFEFILNQTGAFEADVNEAITELIDLNMIQHHEGLYAVK